MNSPALALLLANARYWSSVARPVARQLTRWERAAAEIPDPRLRTPALAKLRDERFNVQVAATLATLAPRRRRADVIEAIVALQVMYDYLDLLSERSTADPGEGRGLFDALIDAVSVVPSGSSDRLEPPHNDGGYLASLARAVRCALARLPGATAVADVAREAAERCGQAQIRHHGASHSGSGSRSLPGSYSGRGSQPLPGSYSGRGSQSLPGSYSGLPPGCYSEIAELRDWATVRAAGTGLGWQELLAGSTASVLAVHALIAAAADPGTRSEDAAELDRIYLSIGALTMLDSLVDREEDIAGGQLSYVDLYDGPEAMAEGLAKVARDGVTRARGLPNGAHHAMTLVGVVGYYASAPTANDDAFARPVIARVKRELQPLITPTLALMRAWRAAKRLRHGGRGGARHGVPQGVRHA